LAEPNHVQDTADALAALKDAWPQLVHECREVLGSEPHNQAIVYQRLHSSGGVSPPPDHLRSDYEPEFTVTVVRDWLGRLEIKTLFIDREPLGKRV
jgi:hypothetical protein